MINTVSAALIKDRSFQVALKVLSSDDLAQFSKEIEDLALQRMAEEELIMPRERERQRVIDGIRVMLALNGITPEELLEFTRGSVRASNRNI